MGICNLQFAICNWGTGFGESNSVHEHPDGKQIIVLAGGRGYVIDPDSRKCLEAFGGDISFVHFMSENAVIVFGNGLWFEAMGMNGGIWRSDRIAWDGVCEVKIDGGRLTGSARDLGGGWIPFEVNLLDGRVIGGSYNGPSDRGYCR